MPLKNSGLAIVIILFIGLIFTPAKPCLSSSTFTVDKAYEAFSKTRTPYLKRLSKLYQKDYEYLGHILYITDLAVRMNALMMLTLKDKSANISYDYYSDEMKFILDGMELYEQPQGMGLPTKQLKKAIVEQAEFFMEWANADNEKKKYLSRYYKRHPLIKSSHDNIQAAYSAITELYPYEDKYNLKAIQDHLYALDLFVK